MKQRRKAKTKDVVVSHFQKRCRQRLGVVLTQSLLKKRLFPGQNCEKQSNTRTKFHLDNKTKDELGISSCFSDVVVVYDKLRHHFVTVLTYQRKEPFNEKQ